MNKKALVLLGCLFLCVAGVMAQGRKAICINEVMVQNDSNYVDDYGMHHAWIELFNSSFASVEISSMYLTNDKANPTMYPVPRMDVNTEIPPRQHVIFWADGEPNKGTFHINFTLEPGKDNWIGLYDADGKTLIDEVVIPASLTVGQSYARIEDGNKGKGEAPAAEWSIRDGSDNGYITPSSNNIIIDKNAKIEMFRENDKSGAGLTILSMAVVFSSLFILCLLFYFVGRLFTKTATIRKTKEVADAGVDESVVTPDSGEEIAAVCMALHEHLNMHDNEDLVLTINKVKRSYSPWNSKIYSLREIPRK